MRFIQHMAEENPARRRCGNTKNIFNLNWAKKKLPKKMPCSDRLIPYSSRSALTTSCWRPESSYCYETSCSSIGRLRGTTNGSLPASPLCLKRPAGSLSGLKNSNAPCWT